MVSETNEPTLWYRCYVLTVLLIGCIHTMAVRNLPSYLISVQVPGCGDLCAGVATTPLCGARLTAERWSDIPLLTKPNSFEACQRCRARVEPYAYSGQQPVPDTELWSSGAGGGGAARPAPRVQAANYDDGGRRLSFAGSAQLQPNPIPVVNNHVRDANFYNLADGACMYNWEYGILIGYGFALIFAIGLVPAGMICDCRPRVQTASIAMFAWSMATLVQATSHDFFFLLICRCFVGVAQAFAMPAFISIVADHFTDNQNLAIVILSLGLYLGSGAASLSMLFAEAIGFRWTLFLAGFVGILTAGILFLTVREPERTEWSAPCPLPVVMDEVFCKSRVARLIIVAGSMKMLAAYVLGTFLPIWYSRRYLPGYSNTTYALWNALIIAVGSICSTALGGVLGEVWGRFDSRVPCFIGLSGAVLALPLIVLLLYVPSFAWSMAFLFFLLLVSESWFVPTVALLQRSVRKSVRGQAVSMCLVATALSANVGPALVGFFDPGDENVRTHILWVSLTANVCAIIAFVRTVHEITIDPVAAGLGDKGLDELPESARQPSTRILMPDRSGVAHWAPF